MTHWILIADASGARAYAVTSRHDELKLVRKYDNPEGAARSQELVTQEAGRVAKAGAMGTRSAMDPRTSAHDDAAHRFSRQLADALHHELCEGSFTSLSIVAPPAFLGSLRGRLGNEVGGHVKNSLPRDLMKTPHDQLRSHIEPLLETGIFIS